MILINVMQSKKNTSITQIIINGRGNMSDETIPGIIIANDNIASQI